jgi:hypothetical protein
VKYPPATPHLPLSARGERKLAEWEALPSEQRLAPGVAWTIENQKRIALLESGKLPGVARRREVRRGIQTWIDWLADGVPLLNEDFGRVVVNAQRAYDKGFSVHWAQAQHEGEQQLAKAYSQELAEQHARDTAVLDGQTFEIMSPREAAWRVAERFELLAGICSANVYYVAPQNPGSITWTWEPESA